MEETIADFAKLGVNVTITELDVDVLSPAHRSLSAEISTRQKAGTCANPFPKELPPAVQEQLADRNNTGAFVFEGAG